MSNNKFWAFARRLFSGVRMGRRGRWVNGVDGMDDLSGLQKTPVIENIYASIASEFAKTELLLTKAQGTDNNGQYERLHDHPLNNVLTVRPNALQTKSELLFTMAYQMQLYGNSLTHIKRDSRTGEVIALEPLDLGGYRLGQGYDVGGALYIKLLEKESNQVILMDYQDLIHLRENPNNLFRGEKRASGGLDHFVKLFDEGLAAVLKDLKSKGKIHGVITLGEKGGGFGPETLADDETKRAKQAELLARAKAGNGLLVLDDGENWQNINRQFNGTAAADVDVFMRYLFAFKGISREVIDGTATSAQMDVFFTKTIVPLIDRLSEEMHYKVLTATDRANGLKIEHFINPFAYLSTRDKLSSLYTNTHFFSQNEVRRLGFRLPPLVGGDELLDNKNFTKNSGNQPDDEGEKDDEAEEDGTYGR